MSCANRASRLIDFETTLPSAVDELIKRREEPKSD
jgi:hypothetical protein